MQGDEVQISTTHPKEPNRGDDLACNRICWAKTAATANSLANLERDRLVLAKPDNLPPFTDSTSHLTKPQFDDRKRRSGATGLQDVSKRPEVQRAMDCLPESDHLFVQKSSWKALGKAAKRTCVAGTPRALPSPTLGRLRAQLRPKVMKSNSSGSFSLVLF